MRILTFSDIHGDRHALQRLLDTEADLYFAAGDLVNWARGFDAVGPILRQRAGRVYVLPGNHESASDIGRFCGEFGLLDLHGQHFEASGYHFAGLGYSTPTPFNTPGECSESEMAAGLAPFASLSPLVLICHAPPLGTPLDEVGPNRHYGSRAVKDFIDAHQPEYFFCGHIHEAAGRQAQFGRTHAVNAGKSGYLLELPPLP